MASHFFVRPRSSPTLRAQDFTRACEQVSDSDGYVALSGLFVQRLEAEVGPCGNGKSAVPVDSATGDTRRGASKTMKYRVAFDLCVVGVVRACRASWLGRLIREGGNRGQ